MLLSMMKAVFVVNRSTYSLENSFASLNQTQNGSGASSASGYHRQTSPISHLTTFHFLPGRASAVTQRSFTVKLLPLINAVKRSSSQLVKFLPSLALSSFRI